MSAPPSPSQRTASLRQVTTEIASPELAANGFVITPGGGDEASIKPELESSSTQASGSPNRDGDVQTCSGRSSLEKDPSQPKFPVLQATEGTAEVNQAASSNPSAAEDAKLVEAVEDDKPSPAPVQAELKHVSVDPAPDIGDETESGWAAIARSIRGIDEQKIKDYKEDIDTILVFAGLYSAVLSALLAESYQALQPDPSAIMIALLSQVVVQTHTYTINSGFLNSTATPLNVNSIHAFTPSLAAKRVNVLWFASLTLSLMSASFGILVKQWLREYLAGEYVSPQAQLRIRHFRTPSLDHWRVFAIAALLPLILQLALALFFVGLCFFTLDIHSSIGYTTVPLVAGWAFLFVAASFAPSVSSRCPYKIPIFKSAMQVLRATLFRTIQLVKGLPSLPAKPDWPITPYWTWWSLGYSENDAAKDARSDVDILVAVDASQTDDQLVMKMCGALKEMHVKPEVMFDFVLKIIGFRLQTEFKTRPLPLMLDLSQLPVQTCTILMDTVADVLEREVRKFPVSDPIKWTDLTRDCLSLLVARLPCLLSNKATTVVSLCFAGTQSARALDTVEMLFTSVEEKERYALCLHLQERTRNAFLNFNAWQFSNTTWVMMHKACCNCDICGSMLAVLGRHAETIPPILRQHMLEITTAYMLHQVKIEATWSEWHKDIGLLLFKEWAESQRTSISEPWHGALKELARHLMTQPRLAPYFYRHLYDRSDYDSSADYIFVLTFPSSTEKVQILDNICEALAAYVVKMTRMPAFLDGTFYAKLLAFIDGQVSPIMYVVDSRNRYYTEEQFLPRYQTMFKILHPMLSRFNPAAVTEAQTKWARTCLANIDKLDGLWLTPNEIGVDVNEDFEKWAKVLNPAKSFFDDEMIEDLMRFLPSPEDAPCNRVRRIIWLRAQQGNSLAEDQKLDVPIKGQADDSRATCGNATASGEDAAAKDEAEHADGQIDDDDDDGPVPVAAIAVTSTDIDMDVLNADGSSTVDNPANINTSTAGIDIRRPLETEELTRVDEQHEHGLLIRAETDSTLVVLDGVADPGGTDQLPPPP